MPSASDELRDLMGEYFGDRISDAGPTQFLLDAGYTEESGLWYPKPGVKTADDMTEKEWNCLAFLIYEWDHAWRQDSKENE